MSVSALAVGPADDSAVIPSTGGSGRLAAAPRSPAPRSSPPPAAVAVDQPVLEVGRAARADIEREFREFVTSRSPALLRTAYLLGGDWATAEDLLQVALTKTYLAWLRLGTIEAVEPYARRVLVNTATSWWRRRWHGERPTEVLPDTPASDGLEERLERDRLWRHVVTLPTRQRAVLVLRFYEDQSEAETARLLGVSVGTVKSQCARALASLRSRLAAEGIEPAASLPTGGRR